MGATASIIIAIPEDLRTLCSGLQQFKLGATLGHLIEDTLIISNKLFRDRVGLSDDFSAAVKLRHLVYLDRRTAMENNDVDQPIEFLPCTLNSLTGDEIIPGRALTRPDGIILLLLVAPATLRLRRLPMDARLDGRKRGTERANSSTTCSVQK
jgi:hypothetical protein